MGIKTNLLPERARLESGDSFLIDAAAGTGRLTIGAAQNQLTRNRNLLINWRFADPINQRGATEYTEPGYTIDLWRMTGNGGKIAILPGSGIVLDNTAGTEHSQMYEIVEMKDILGKEVSFSIIADGKLISAQGFVFPKTEAQVVYDDKKIALILRVMDDGYPSVCVWVYTGNKFTISAAKLELGSQQTLAHQDASGNWVLNDPPPDKALELLKCQRYLILGKLYGFCSYVSANTLGFCVPTGVTMRKNPDLVGSFQIIKQPNDQSVAGFTFTAIDARKNQLMVTVKKENHGITMADAPLLYLSADSGASSEL